MVNSKDNFKIYNQMYSFKTKRILINLSTSDSLFNQRRQHRGQYLAILTEYAWSKYLLYGQKITPKNSRTQDYLHFARSRGQPYNKKLYYTTKAVPGPINKINQSDCFITGPARSDIFQAEDRVLSRKIPRVSAEDSSYFKLRWRTVRRSFFG